MERVSKEYLIILCGFLLDYVDRVRTILKYLLCACIVSLCFAGFNWAISIIAFTIYCTLVGSKHFKHYRAVLMRMKFQEFLTKRNSERLKNISDEIKI